jgi:hypothetical protein
MLSASSYLTEPPDADPHVRWCGRAAGITPAPYPNLPIERLAACLILIPPLQFLTGSPYHTRRG